jgi:hypothetical protein
VGEVSYDLYVKHGVDSMGRDVFGKAIARFTARGNAVTLKRQLVARGRTVRVEKSIVHGLSEEEKEHRFSDYHRGPEHSLLSDQSPAQGASEVSQDAAVDTSGYALISRC